MSFAIIAIDIIASASATAIAMVAAVTRYYLPLFDV
jgi:hypothetical protein